MIGSCSYVNDALAELDRHWPAATLDGCQAPADGRASVNAALDAADVLAQHGWHHRRLVQIRHLRVMLALEQRVPAHS